MASYTIEDIELIRRKSGISYQEAVALLDYHNGNVARALVDLERNGRIRPESAAQADKTAKSGKSSAHHGRSGFSNLMTRLYQFRLKVKKGDITILNLSMLFALLGVIISPHLAIIAAVLILVLGYRVSFDKRDPAFASENLEKMVRNAAQNVKSSVNDFTRGFNDGFEQRRGRIREARAERGPGQDGGAQLLPVQPRRDDLSRRLSGQCGRAHPAGARPGGEPGRQRQR